jgi:hypothetical protein
METLSTLESTQKADVPVDQPYLGEPRRNMTIFALPSVPSIDSLTADDDSTKGDTLVRDAVLAGGASLAADGNRQDHQNPTALERDENIAEQLINGVRLLEYRKTGVKDRLPAIYRPNSQDVRVPAAGLFAAALAQQV